MWHDHFEVLLRLGANARKKSSVKHRLSSLYLKLVSAPCSLHGFHHLLAVVNQLLIRSMREGEAGGDAGVQRRVERVSQRF